MELIKNLFGETKDKRLTIKSERALVISDILTVVNSTEGIKRRVTARNAAVFLAPFKVPDLYVFLSKLKQSKTPASMFWYYVKTKK